MSGLSTPRAESRAAAPTEYGRGDSDVVPPHAVQATVPRGTVAGRPRRPRLKRPKSAAADTEIVFATAGDHALIHGLLKAVHQRPSREVFQTSLDAPAYSPRDRLLLKHRGRLVSHLQLTQRQMRFGSVQLPVVWLEWLATLPEYRGHGYTGELIEQALRQVRGTGPVLAALNVRNPRALPVEGWSHCHPRAVSHATARDILAVLESRRATCQRPPLQTRVWRHVELAALMEIYDQATAYQYGPVARSEVYWQWLTSRKAYDQILVAVEGNDTLDFGEHAAMIVGYAAVRESRIVELMTLRSHRHATIDLLARACRDAIERDDSTVYLDAPADDPLHKLLVHAGGQWLTAAGACCESWLVRGLDVGGLVRQLHPELLMRARQAGIQLPWEMRIDVDGVPHRWVLSRRSARLLPGGHRGRRAVSLGAEAFTQLLLGALNVPAARAAKQMDVATKGDEKMLTSLCPPLTVWRPPLDQLHA